MSGITTGEEHRRTGEQGGDSASGCHGQPPPPTLCFLLLSLLSLSSCSDRSGKWRGKETECALPTLSYLTRQSICLGTNGETKSLPYLAECHTTRTQTRIKSTYTNTIWIGLQYMQFDINVPYIQNLNR